MSWWTNLFGGKKETGKETTPIKARPPSYQELVARVGELEDQVANERKTTAEKRQRVASRAREDQMMLARYRDALEFYANESHWRPLGLVQSVAAHVDRGYKARKALGRV